MKRYRVWAYETIGHYIEIDAQNKSDAYNKAMDVNVLDWIQSGGDEIGAGYTGFLWPLYLDQLKKDGHDKAWSSFLKNLLLYLNF